MFETEDLVFSAWLHSMGKLRFVRCESNELGRITFIFSDPEGHGEALLAEFINGSALCPVRTFYDSIRCLRTAMNRSKETNYVPYQRNRR